MMRLGLFGGRRAGRLCSCIFCLALCLAAAGCRKNGTAAGAGGRESVPRRIVSLAPSVTEIVCAVGAFGQLAARSDFCDEPPEVRVLPSAGGFDGNAVSLEALLSFSPDLVCLSAGMHDFLIPPLEAQGVPCFVSCAESVEGVLDEILEVGRITGHDGEAEALSAEIRERLAGLAAQSAARGSVRSVYWEVWNPPYISVGNASFIDELISAAGGRNIFADIAQPYPVVSEELILARAPDVIFVSEDGAPLEAVLHRAGWQDIPAVKAGNVYALDAGVVSRPGPRIADAAALIAAFLHPELDLDCGADGE